jgi:NADP-dependent 3-hydroxy acid dehydrogenase YdfG
VNNAGLASGLSAIQEGDVDDWEKMIDTNIKGLLYVSRAVVQGMIERGRGTSLTSAQLPHTNSIRTEMCTAQQKQR